MAVEFTTEQKNAIKAEGTVLVSAAAGSGKTAVLTERVVRKICDADHPVSADRFLIVTFTNASALEMRVRIGKRLDEECGSRKKNTYILKQKLLLKNAEICTIDSFCINLIRKYFGVLGISPDFRIADSAQTAVLRDTCIKDVLTRHYAAPDAAFDRLALSFGIDKGEKALTEAVLKIYDYSMCMPQPVKWLDNAAAEYFIEPMESAWFWKTLFESAENELRTAADRAAFILREITGTEFEKACYDGFFTTAEQLSVMLDAAEKKDWDNLYLAAHQFEKTLMGTVRKPKDPELREVIKSTRDNIFDTVKSIETRMCGTKEEVLRSHKTAGTAVRALVTLVTEFSDAYTAALERRNMLTFAHAEQLALKLLCTETEDGLVPSELSREICRRYDEVLVDEYQDNNDLQDALFYAVSDGGKHLFMVGDVKQSIYGFRGANPDNFLKHKDAYPPYDGSSDQSKVILSSNFRSRSLICDFVNAFCSAVMQKATCGMDYTAEDELVYGASYRKTGEQEVDLCVTEYSKKDYKCDEADAASVADYIEKILSAEAFIKDGDGLRRAEYRDIAVLLRAPKSRASHYTEALKKRGIPTDFGGGDFFTSPEILTAMSFLQVINNPTRDIPLLSVMTSAAFGFTPDDLAELKIKYNGKNIYAQVLAAAENGDKRYRDMLDVLARLRTAAATLPVWKLINEMYRVTMLKEIMSAMPDGAVKKTNLARLSAMAAEYEECSDGGLSGFIDYIGRMSDEGERIESLSDVNAVKIMSFHGSKGLQFPVCIVAGCGGEFNKRDITDTLIINSGGIGMKCLDETGEKITTAVREALSAAELKKLISEEIRLFYVAMTRAEERLMISVASENPKKEIADAAAALGIDAVATEKAPSGAVLSSKGIARMIFMTALLQKDGKKVGEYAGVNPVGTGDGTFRFSVFKPLTDTQTDAPEREILPDKKADAEIVAKIKERLEFSYPYENACGVPSKIAVTELVHGDRQRYAFHLRPQFLSKAGLTPAERGTAAHKFMQFADYERAEQDAAAELSRLAEWEYLSEEEANAVDVGALSKFFESSVYGRMKQSSNVMREYKFMTEYPYLGENTMIQGIADCVFEEPNGMVILDFKTDTVKNAEELAARYAPQLSIYQYAVSEIFGRPVTDCIIYSLHLGKEIPV